MHFFSVSNKMHVHCACLKLLFVDDIMNILSVLHELQCFVRFEDAKLSFLLVARGTAELGVITFVCMGK